MKITVGTKKDRMVFVAVSKFEERNVLKSAGFWWDPEAKRWYTYDPLVAAALVDHADDPAKAEIEKAKGTLAESRATNADIEIPAPDGLTYMPFQKAGIAYGLERDAVLIGDEPGLGKTIQAVGIINSMPKPDRVLVVCPASLKINWRRETEKWLVHDMPVRIVNGGGLGPGVNILNYDILHKHPVQDIEWDVLIADECFPHDTPVVTDKGIIPIGQIVDNRLNVAVLSCDLSCNTLSFKKVSRWVKKQLSGPMMAVHHATGTLTCTANHKILTEERGYVRADEIKSGETLRVLRENLHDHSKRKSNGQILLAKMRRTVHISRPRSERTTFQVNEETVCRKSVRVVRKRIQYTLTGKNRREKTLLQHKLLGKMAQHTTMGKGEFTQISPDSTGKQQGTEETRRKRAYEAAQSRSRVQEENANGSTAEKRETVAGDQGREWEGPQPPNACSVESGRDKDRIPHPNTRSARQFQETTYMLQSRSCACGVKNGYRDRREVSPRPSSTETRREENSSFERSRVVRVEVLKQGSQNKSLQRCPGDQTVYNLEVEDNHNYFANGVLVSNCHYIKNPKALRTKALTAIKARKRILLTGTPIVNRPVELFPLINYLNPGEFPKFFPYAKRYCAAVQTRWGWDFSGASNLGELQNRLRRTVLVRRLKKDVLTELPPKVRQIVEVPANGCTGAIEKEKATWSGMRERLADLRVAVELAKARSEEEYLQAVSRLREGAQAAFEEFSAVRLETAMAKVPHVVDFLKEILESENKVVVFAHHHAVVDAIRAEFPDNSVVLTGRESQSVRQEAVDRFQTDPTVNVFIGSITAAGVGITLTAASHVVFGELDWVPGNMSQSEDRLHRIGQKDSVFVQHVVLEDSIDARMARTLVAKQAVIDAAMDAEVEIRKVPVLPLPEIEECPTVRRSRKEIHREAEELTPEQIAAVHTALRIVQGVCDKARELDGMGFSKFDVRLGHALAWEESLTPAQAAIGRHIVMKYKKQYSEDLFRIIKGEKANQTDAEEKT